VENKEIFIDILFTYFLLRGLSSLIDIYKEPALCLLKIYLKIVEIN